MPVIQVIVFAPLADNNTELPLQIVWSIPALIIGKAFTVTVTGALELSHPLLELWLT